MSIQNSKKIRLHNRNRGKEDLVKPNLPTNNRRASTRRWLAHKVQLHLNTISGKQNKINYHPAITKEWPQRERWYPNGVKIVPKDLMLTPLICNRWHVDDVYMSIVDEKTICTISLCTDSFCDEDIDFLRLQIKDKIGIDSGIRTVHRKFKRIVIYTKKRVHDFLHYIGEYPSNDYKYKWDI